MTKRRRSHIRQRRPSNSARRGQRLASDPTASHAHHPHASTTRPMCLPQHPARPARDIHARVRQPIRHESTATASGRARTPREAEEMTDPLHLPSSDGSHPATTFRSEPDKPYPQRTALTHLATHPSAGHCNMMLRHYNVSSEQQWLRTKCSSVPNPSRPLLIRSAALQNPSHGENESPIGDSREQQRSLGIMEIEPNQT